MTLVPILYNGFKMAYGFIHHPLSEPQYVRYSLDGSQNSWNQYDTKDQDPYTKEKEETFLGFYTS